MPAHRLVAQCSLCNAAASLDRFISRSLENAPGLSVDLLKTKDLWRRQFVRRRQGAFSFGFAGQRPIMTGLKTEPCIAIP